MRRREFVAGGIALAAGAAALPARSAAEAVAARRIERIIDVHCHVFNAADLPIEGFTIAFNGTLGRLEAEECWGPYLGRPADNPFDRYGLRLYPTRGPKEIIPVPIVVGGHAGGDERLLDMLFGAAPDTLGQHASAHDAALSIAVGDAANESIARGRAIPTPSLLDRDSGR